MDHNLPYTFQQDAYYTAEPEEIDLFANLILACAKNNLSPLSTAQKITNELANLSWRNKETIDANNENRPYTTKTTLIAILLASCASSFPPCSVVHERIFALIKSFFAKVEKRDIIPNYSLDKNGGLRNSEVDGGDVRISILLWGSRSSLTRLADVGVPWTEVEKCGSKEQQRWRNLSFFMARLTVMGVEKLGWKSALQRLLPRYGMPVKGTLAWSGDLAGQALAAAQWFVHEGHGEWVWRACCRGERPEASVEVVGDQRGEGVEPKDGDATEKDGDGSGSVTDSNERESFEENQVSKWLFNLKSWKIWKASFEEIIERIDDPRVHELARSEASKALEIMEDLERQ
ncbi:hypothetical protein D6C77_10817 [Aureobasidium pullulans]|nr:hypothetical protein D6C77_10817 [Aureobasidium pullulans]